ncbi:type II secretion system minor pseudopilin GspH [Endozoicomonas acroporae]|uniref:type II secretion system minor pseudopilin GspH n=1 Tax=Endozoicomonas acroporae TaxID=1701104 RepID=UPI003D798DBA
MVSCQHVNRQKSIRFQYRLFGQSGFTSAYHGFTLVEIMLVIVIIGIMLGLVTLSPRTEKTTTLREAERLQLLFSLLRDKALMENGTYGFSLMNNQGYKWWQWSDDNKHWQVMQKESFQNYPLPKRLQLQWQWQHSPYASFSFVSGTQQPEVVVFSDFLITPFQLQISEGAEKTVLLSSDGWSDVVIQ